MARALHRAISDALRDAPGYATRGVLPALVLEAHADLEEHEGLLYQAVYTIFVALPERLLPGSVLRVTTEDGEDGVILTWTAKEAMEPREEDLATALGRGPHGDLLAIAFLALDRFCRMRAGSVIERRGPVQASSSFGYPAHAVRTVTATIPSRRALTPLQAGKPGGVGA